MPLYLTTTPWFYGGQYYHADVLNPFVFTHAGEPGLNWYPLDREAEIALQKQSEKIKAAGVLIAPAHKIPDTRSVKLPDPVEVPVVKPYVGETGPFGRVPSPEADTMSGQQGKPPRPSDVEPTQIKK